MDKPTWPHVVTLVRGSYRCGYLRFPEEAQPTTEGAEDVLVYGVDIPIHGGWTWHGEDGTSRVVAEVSVGSEQVGFWAGFDCAHCDDTLECWTLEAVLDELASAQTAAEEAIRAATFGANI